MVRKLLTSNFFYCFVSFVVHLIQFNFDLIQIVNGYLQYNILVINTIIFTNDHKTIKLYVTGLPFYTERGPVSTKKIFFKGKGLPVLFKRTFPN